MKKLFFNKLTTFNENQLNNLQLKMMIGGTSTSRNSSTYNNTSTNINLGSSVVGVNITDPELRDGDITDPEIDDAVSASYSDL